MREQSDRIYFLDNLRAIVILLVVVLHGALTYMAFAPDWWYVVDPQNSLFFTALVLLVDIPIMQVMFFISAYFVLASLNKRGQITFLKDKFIRIGAPWIFGGLLLAPPTAYLIYYSRHVPMGFFQFWATDFWGAMYQQSVYWYLGVLFFFFVVLGLVIGANRRLLSGTQQFSRPSWKMLVTFWAVMTVGMLFISQFFSVDTWYTRLYLLVIQPARVPLYIGYFVLGIIAYKNGWFTAEGYKPDPLPWTLLWIFSGLFYLGNRLSLISPAGQSPFVIQVENVCLFNAFCLSSLMAGAALFQGYLNKTGKYWKSLTTSSYGIYYIHPLILYPCTYIFVGITIPLFLKAPMVILLAILLSWAASALVLRRAPILRRIF